MKLTLLIMLFGLANIGCSNEIALGSGYKIVKTDSYNQMIVDKKNKIIVDPHIDRYVSNDLCIVGIRTQSDLLSREEEIKFGYQKPGFFLLDIKTGLLEVGLSKELLAQKSSVCNLNLKELN